MPFTYEYPRPALTVDCVVFGFDGGGLQVLLIRRALEPFLGSWALPGGFVDMDEDLDQAARRELQEETHLSRVFLEQLFTFGTPGRDPRGRVVSVAYYALVRPDQHPATGDSDASEAAWHPVDQLPPLAFDHTQIIAKALERLRGKIRYQPVGFELLPKHFTLTQLQSLYEAILGRSHRQAELPQEAASLRSPHPARQIHQRCPPPGPALSLRSPEIRHSRAPRLPLRTLTPMNSPLQTDLYQLTMAAAYWQAGKADQESVFQLFFRRLPFKGGYAIAAGLAPALEWLKDFRFRTDEIDYLSSLAHEKRLSALSTRVSQLSGGSSARPGC